MTDRTINDHRLPASATAMLLPWRPPGAGAVPASPPRCAAADPPDRAASPGPAHPHHQGGLGMTTHATPEELRLRLHLPAGRIEITTWAEPTTEVEVEPLDGSAAAAELAAAVQQQLRERPGGH